MEERPIGYIDTTRRTRSLSLKWQKIPLDNGQEQRKRHKKTTGVAVIGH